MPEKRHELRGIFDYLYRMKHNGDIDEGQYDELDGMLDKIFEHLDGVTDNMNQYAESLQMWHDKYEQCVEQRDIIAKLLLVSENDIAVECETCYYYERMEAGIDEHCHSKYPCRNKSEWIWYFKDELDALCGELRKEITNV